MACPGIDGQRDSGSFYYYMPKPICRNFVSCTSNLELFQLGDIVPKKGKLPSGDSTMVTLNWKIGLPHGHFGLLRLLNQQQKKGASSTGRMIEPD